VRKTLNSLATSSTDAPRLDRALQRAKSSFLFDLQSNQSRANTFGEYEVIFGDARVVFTDLERLLSVTPEDIRHAASQFVSPTTQTIVRVTPVALPLAGAKGGAR